MTTYTEFIDVSDLSVHEKIIENKNKIVDWVPENYEFHFPKSDFENIKILNVELCDIFKDPDFHSELKTLATNESENKRKSLQKSHLDEIKKTGQFLVPSGNFPGENYVWKISQLIMKGKENVLDAFMDDIAFATSCFIVFIPDLLVRNRTFSIRSRLAAFFTGLYHTATLLPGRSMTRLEDLGPYEVDQMRIKMLLDNLFDEENCRFVKDTHELQLKIGEGKINITMLDNMSYFSLNHDLGEKIKVALKDLQIQQIKKRKEKLYTHKNNDEANKILFEQMRKKEIEEQQEEVYAKIKEHPDLMEKDKTVMVNILKAVRAIRIAKEKQTENRELHKNLYSTSLEKHSILSRINRWKAQKIEAFLVIWDMQNNLSDYILNEMEKQNIKKNSAEFILFLKNLNLMTSNPHTQEKIVPEKNWRFRIWRHKNWKISKVTKQPHGSSFSYFVCEKYRRATGKKNYVGWKIVFLIINTAEFTYNFAFLCCCYIAVGHFGFRSLFGLEDYRPVKDIDQSSGEIVSVGPICTTWFGRVKKLWVGVRLSRFEFTQSANTGFFGKGISNPIHCFWNYVCIGLFGTLFIFLLHPLLSLISISLAFVLLLTSPLCCFFAAVLKYCLECFIYNRIDGYFPIFQVLILETFLKGFCGVLLCSFGLVGSLLIGCLFYCWAVVRLVLRQSYDNIMFFLLVKPFAKIPYSDTFTAKLVAGPGLGMKHYYRIQPEMVRLLMSIILEKEELASYIRFEERIIEKPIEKYCNYLGSFAQHGLLINYNHADYNKFVQTKEILVNRLKLGAENLNNEKFRLKEKNLRMTEKDLNVVLKNCCAFIKNFYHKRIYKYMSDNEITSMWLDKDLEEEDWEAFTKHWLKECFGSSILQSIEKVDQLGFKLAIKPLDTQQFFKNTWEGDVKDDLQYYDVIEAKLDNDIVVPKSNSVLVKDLETKLHLNEYPFSYENFTFLIYNHELREKIEKKINSKEDGDL